MRARNLVHRLNNCWTIRFAIWFALLYTRTGRGWRPYLHCFSFRFTHRDNFCFQWTKCFPVKGSKSINLIPFERRENILVMHLECQLIQASFTIVLIILCLRQPFLSTLLLLAFVGASGSCLTRTGEYRGMDRKQRLIICTSLPINNLKTFRNRYSDWIHAFFGIGLYLFFSDSARAS